MGQHQGEKWKRDWEGINMSQDKKSSPLEANPLAEPFSSVQKVPDFSMGEQQMHNIITDGVGWIEPFNLANVQVRPYHALAAEQQFC